MSIGVLEVQPGPSFKQTNASRTLLYRTPPIPLASALSCCFISDPPDLSTWRTTGDGRSYTAILHLARLILTDFARVADHELDMNPYIGQQIDIYNGRGVLIEGDRGNWLVGTGFEHSTLYNYQVANANYVYLGAIQAETA